MTRAKNATQCGLDPHWKVRVYLPGSVLWLISRTEPVVHRDGSRIANVEVDLITGTEHGDTIGFIDWSVVISVTWRFAPSAPLDLEEEELPKKPARNSSPASKAVGKRIAAAHAVLRNRRH